MAAASDCSVPDSYALMTMLIVEQGHTIESKCALIRELLTDSKELSAAEGERA